MASIRKRGRGYYVQIGKNGYQTLTHTLSSLSLARKGTAGVEPIWSGIYRAEDLLGRNINEIEWDKSSHLNHNENKSQKLRKNRCLFLKFD